MNNYQKYKYSYIKIENIINSFLQEESLLKKLSQFHSWIAVEKYGLKLYGENFRLYYLFGDFEESLKDENTWFLKATCSVFGVDKTCEATVTGTTENPIVVTFEVY